MERTLGQCGRRVQGSWRFCVPGSIQTPKPFDRNLAYQLYRQVLGPIEEIISQKTRLSFVLDGALTSLPPQVLITTDPDGKDLNSLIGLFVNTPLQSCHPSQVSRFFEDEKSTVAALKPMIGFGDPVFDRTTRTTGRPEGGGSQPEPDQLLPRRDRRYQRTRRSVACSSGDR